MLTAGCTLDVGCMLIVGCVLTVACMLTVKCLLIVDFKLCSITEVEEMFEQRYGYTMKLSTAVVTSGPLVMAPQGILARMLLNLKNIYTGPHGADKVLLITRYLRYVARAIGTKRWHLAKSDRPKAWHMLASRSMCRNLT